MRIIIIYILFALSVAISGCPSGDPDIPPTAAFSAHPATGIAPLQVQFQDESIAGSAPISSWQWQFGNGLMGYGRTPRFTFASPGTYAITLTVQSASGTDTETRDAFIEVSAPPVLPIASFTATPTTGLAPLEVAFTDTSSTGSAPVISRQWDFGDGQTSQENSPVHNYAAAGVYTVSFTIATLAGSSTDTQTNMIAVAAPQLPSAAFSASISSEIGGVTVAFTDASTPGSAPITNWFWDFGDGVTSTEQNPEHTYDDYSGYSVMLQVNTAYGVDAQTKTALISRPAVSFIPSLSDGIAPLEVTFENTTTGTSLVTDWLWDFGDGSTSTQQNPTHLFRTAGFYTVTLTANTQLGSFSTNDFINALQPLLPRADFTAFPRNGVAPLEVAFSNSSTPGTFPILSRVWDFGDGSSSTEVSPSHTYEVPGLYTVSLTVTSSAGTDAELKVGYIDVTVRGDIVSQMVWKSSSNVEGNWMGTSVAAAGDTNQDGYSDLLIGTPDFTNPEITGRTHGRAQLYLGGAAGPGEAVWSATGQSSFDWYGRDLAGAGDVNGDGFDDIAIGAEEWINGAGFRGGKVYVHHGGADGLELLPSFTASGTPDANTHMGVYVSGAGDINDDGYDDVVAGITSTTAPGSLCYLGSRNGLLKDAGWLGVRDAVTGVGDTNDDGFDDVACGTYFNYGFGSGVFLYHGGLSGLTRTAVWNYMASTGLYGPRFARHVAGAGDVNGDGYDDILVGDDSVSSDKGAVLLFYGASPQPAVAPAWTFTGNDEFARLGVEVDGVGDINRDGYSDVAVSAIQRPPFSPCSAEGEGVVLIFLGGSEGLGVLPTLVLHGDCHSETPNYTTSFGRSLDGPLDTDNDGNLEVVVGAPDESEFVAVGGAVYLFELSLESQTQER